MGWLLLGKTNKKLSWKLIQYQCWLRSRIWNQICRLPLLKWPLLAKGSCWDKRMCIIIAIILLQSGACRCSRRFIPSQKLTFSPVYRRTSSLGSKSLIAHWWRTRLQNRGWSKRRRTRSLMLSSTKRSRSVRSGVKSITWTSIKKPRSMIGELPSGWSSSKTMSLRLSRHHPETLAAHLTDQSPVKSTSGLQSLINLLTWAKNKMAH